MPVILIDADMEGQGARIWAWMQSPYWREITAYLDVTCKRFRDVGLDAATSDDTVWRFCQANRYYLLTSNRNEDSEDSLEATIRREWTSASLPVFTLARPARVNEGQEFLNRVVGKLFEFLLTSENIPGTARLYVP